MFRGIGGCGCNASVQAVRIVQCGGGGWPERGSLKKNLPGLHPTFHHVYICSFTSEIFPTAWKSAIIRPILKIPVPSSPGHYRPISILCVLSKILERLAFGQITSYLTREGLVFDRYQSAYREGLSTQTALLRVLEEIREAADCRMVTVVVLFDLFKAFDRVNHRMLLTRLEGLGFSGAVCRWFWSYLSGRRHAVGHGGERSAWVDALSRVPQGSVLGPLLFSIYISDLRDLRLSCEYNLYADDLLIYKYVLPGGLPGAIEDINRDVAAICGWTTAKSLVINQDKIKAMIVGTSRMAGVIDLDLVEPVTMEGMRVHYSSSVWYLGQTISRSLSWGDQVGAVVANVNKTVQLKTCRHLLPLDLRIRLVKTLVLPHIDYCCVAYLDVTAGQDERLQ